LDPCQSSWHLWSWQVMTFADASSSPKMTIKGQFSSISHVLVPFTPDNLHHLASDSIYANILFNTNSHNLLVPDVLTALRLATLDILINACTRTP
jgi:hypothetical protein